MMLLPLACVLWWLLGFPLLLPPLMPMWQAVWRQEPAAAPRHRR